MAADDSKFEFLVLPSDTLQSKSKEATELFKKWGLENGMRTATFTYNRHFQPYLKDSFVKDFFQSPVVNSTLQVVSSSGQQCPLSLAADINRVLVEEVPCSVLNMEFFDRIYSAGVVRQSSGSIVKCFDEVCGDFLISDELRKVLLDEESDNYGIFTEVDREEFLFRVFKHLVLGGPVNQYEDDIQPYLDTTKQLYKDLLTVVKDPNTQRISIASTVLKVQAKVDEHLVFPGQSEHEQSFSYLTVDNFKRHVKAWYHIWY